MQAVALKTQLQRTVRSDQSEGAWSFRPSVHFLVMIQYLLNQVLQCSLREARTLVGRSSRDLCNLSFSEGARFPLQMDRLRGEPAMGQFLKAEDSNRS